MHRCIIEKLKEKWIAVSTMIKTVIDKELVEWKRKQQLAGNGGDFDTNYLDIIQTWSVRHAKRNLTLVLVNTN